MKLRALVMRVKKRSIMVSPPFGKARHGRHAEARGVGIEARCQCLNQGGGWRQAFPGGRVNAAAAACRGARAWWAPAALWGCAQGSVQGPLSMPIERRSDRALIRMATTAWVSPINV